MPDKRIVFATQLCLHRNVFLVVVAAAFVVAVAFCFVVVAVAVYCCGCC